MPFRNPSLEHYRRLAEFRHRIRAFLSFSEHAARAAGIEPQQHQLLLACKGLPEDMNPTIGTLAQRLCIEHHSAVALVDKLEAASLVRRVPGQRDRRQVLIGLTASGERLLSSLSSLHTDQLMKDGPALLRALASILEAASAEGSRARGRSARSSRARS